MKLPHRQLHSLDDAAQNFEQIEQQPLYSGGGTPAFRPTEHVAYYFRLDTPGTALQRLYVFNGTTWTGIL